MKNPSIAKFVTEVSDKKVTWSHMHETSKKVTNHIFGEISDEKTIKKKQDL